MTNSISTQPWQVILDQRTHRLLRRKRTLSTRLAMAEISQQQMLAQAAELSAQIQETEQLAPEAVKQNSKPLARELAERLQSLDEALNIVHSHSIGISKKIDMYLRLLERQELRLQWLARRRAMCRTSTSAQRQAKSLAAN